MIREGMQYAIFVAFVLFIWSAPFWSGWLK